MSDTDLDRSERERRYAERGKRLLEEFEGRKASISEEDKRRACQQLGIPYTTEITSTEGRKREIEEIKNEIARLKERLDMIRRPKSFKHAIGGNEKEEEKPILPSH